MDSILTDLLAVMGRFLNEQIVKTADERAALVIPKAREGLATQASVEALTKAIADLRADLRPLATKAALADAVRPLATVDGMAEAIARATNPLMTKTASRDAIAQAVEPLATKAGVETAMRTAITAATNGRPNFTAMNQAIADAVAPLATAAAVAAALEPLAAKAELAGYVTKQELAEALAALQPPADPVEEPA